MLRSSFIVNSLSHCSRALRVLWKDGVECVYPSTWLRSTVRDERFFDQKGLMYEASHLQFTSSPDSTLKHAGVTKNSSGEESITVEWNDHVTEFNASWLRGEDVSRLPAELSGEFQRQYWDASFNPPEHIYIEDDHEANCEAWIGDLLQYGALLVHNIPPTRDGIRDVMQTFGPLRQRIHPTNIFTLKVGYASGELLDKGAYGKAALGAHTDGCENQMVPRIEAFLCQHYSAPEGDTVSLITDGLKVAKEFSRDHPEEYNLLSGTSLRFGRLRLTTEEECPDDDQRMYHRHSLVSSPIIITNEDGSPARIRMRHCKHIGLPLSGADQEYYMAYYEAYKLFYDKLNDRSNQARFTLRGGTMLLFDNYRICHGRDKIFPSTTRSMLGAYISNEVFQSRYRLLLLKKSHLEPKWTVGCSTATLEALANRFQPQ